MPAATIRFLAALALTGAAGALLLAACGDDPTGPIPAELAGRWDAAPHCLPECRFVLRSVPDPTDSLNITANLSASLILEIERSGAFELSLAGAGTTGFDDSGTLSMEPGILILEGASGTDTLDYTLGTYLDLSFRERLAFDFDGDGTDEEATASARLAKVE